MRTFLQCAIVVFVFVAMGGSASGRSEIAGRGVALRFCDATDGFACEGLVARDGSVSFFNGRSGTNGLWRLRLRKGISGADVELFPNANGSCTSVSEGLRFEWKGLDLPDEPASFDVRCDVVWNVVDRQFEFRIAAENRSRDWGLVETEYPILGAPVPRGAGAAYLPGGNWGLRRVTDDSVTVRTVYPSCCAPMQFMAFERNGVVAYLAAHDPSAREKIVFATAHAGASFCCLAEEAGVPGACRTPDYPVVLGLGRGTWWQAARRYRAWAKANAPWLRQGTLARQSNRPASLDDVGFWLLLFGAPAETERTVAAFSERVAGRTKMGIHWYNWQNHPHDYSYPEYFPPKEGFAETVRRLRAAGHVVMPYVNARLWDSEIASFADKARPSAAKNEIGGVYVEVYGSNRRLSPMCPSAPVWQGEVNAVVRRLFEGFDVDAVYLDQVGASKPARCFDAVHGHPRGGGCHWVDGYRKMLDGLHSDVRSKGGFLATENWVEPYLDVIDAQLTWSPNTEADVPALPAVYSGYTTAFAASATAADDYVSFRALQMRSFLWGAQVGWLGPWLLDEEHREHLELLVRLGEMRCAHKDLLVAGELVGEVPNTVRGSPVDVVWHYSGVRTASLAPVQAMLWRASDGVGETLVVANLADGERMFRGCLKNGDVVTAELTPGEIKFVKIK